VVGNKERHYKNGLARFEQKVEGVVGETLNEQASGSTRELQS